MKNNPFALDVALSPADELQLFMTNGGWVICITALLVIAATIGIVFFIKKKKENKK